MVEIFAYYREKNELIHIQESDSEPNTVEYSLCPVTRIGDIDLTDEEYIYAKLNDPRDGGWFTFDDNIENMSDMDIVSNVIGFAYDLDVGTEVEVYFIKNFKIK